MKRAPWTSSFAWLAVVLCSSACDGNRSRIAVSDSCALVDASGEAEFIVLPDTDSPEALTGIRFHPEDPSVLELIPWAADQLGEMSFTAIYPYSKKCVRTQNIVENQKLPARLLQDEDCKFEIVLSSIDDSDCNRI